MAVGRISGPLLKANLLRNGVDLAFETDLLYLDVNNNRIGVKTASPAYDVDVNGTINATNLQATNQIEVGNLNLQNNTISSNLGTIELLPAGNDPVIYHSKIHVDSLEFNDNYITTLDSNAPIELRPNGTGTIELVGNTNVTGNLFATGNITAAGNITLGDGNLDNVQINADVVSDIVPDVSDTYRLGLPTKRWKTIDANNANIGELQIVDNILEPINTNEDLIIRDELYGLTEKKFSLTLLLCKRIQQLDQGHPKAIDTLTTDYLESVIEEVKEDVPESSTKKHLLMGLGALAFAWVASVAPADFLSHFTVFVLACVVGYYVM